LSDFNTWREPEEISSPNFFVSPPPPMREEPPPKQSGGLLSSLLNSGAFDIGSILSLLNKDNSLLTTLLPMLLNKKPTPSKEPVVEFDDYKRVR